MGVLDVSAPSRGLNVFIDGEPIGETPIAQLEIPIGQHRVSVEGEGFKTYEETINVFDGDKIVVVAQHPVAEILPYEKDNTLFNDGVGIRRPRSRRRVCSWWSRFRPRRTVQRDRIPLIGSLSSAAPRIETMHKTGPLLADVFFGFGAAAAITGGVLMLLDDGVETGPNLYEKDMVLAPSFRLSPTVTSDGVGLGAMGTF